MLIVNSSETEVKVKVKVKAEVKVKVRLAAAGSRNKSPVDSRQYADCTGRFEQDAEPNCIRLKKRPARIRSPARPCPTSSFRRATGSSGRE